MSNKKCRINIIIIGHVNSGKATSMGHLIYNCASIDRKTFEAIEKKSIQASIEKDKEPLKYVWILEKLKANYESGDSIDSSLWQIETNKNYITIIDAPGHCNFMRNIIMGLIQADGALLVVNAAHEEFEIGFSKNGQMRAQIQLVQVSGIQQMIVAINKMDMTEPPFSEKRFDEIKTEISNYLIEIGYQPTMLVFVPISGWHGDNLIHVSENIPWFSGWCIERQEEYIKGKTILEALDIIGPFEHPIKKPLRLPLADVYKIGGIGTVPVGRVSTGTIRSGMIVNFAPSNLTSVVKSLECYKYGDEATPGDYLGFNIKDITINQLQRGFVCSDVQNDPAQEVTSFTAYLIILSHSKLINQGYTPILSCHTARVECQFTKLIEKIDHRTGRTVEDSPKCLKSKDVAIVNIIPLSPLSVEKFADYPSLGRFLIHDMEQAIAVGIIKDVTKRNNIILHPPPGTKKRT